MSTPQASVNPRCDSRSRSQKSISAVDRDTDTNMQFIAIDNTCPEIRRRGSISSHFTELSSLSLSSSSSFTSKSSRISRFSKSSFLKSISILNYAILFYLFTIITFNSKVSANESDELHRKASLAQKGPGYQPDGGGQKTGKVALTNKDNDDFMSAFYASISVILVSEIGDKTFFISAIMSATYSRATVFTGAMSALAIMTAMSAFMGSFLTSMIKVEYTRAISNILFVLFGLRSLREGINMSSNEDSEFKETDAELKEAQEQSEKESLLANSSTDPELGIGSSKSKSGGKSNVPKPVWKRCLNTCLSKVFIQAFTMNFLAEWGDRSQITTIILGTTDDPFGVTAGGCLGHFICTGCACLGGRMIAQKISVKTITLLGGVVFIIFAIHGFYGMFVDIDPQVEIN